MNNDLKNRLLKAMKERGIKTPALSKATGIPQDRIYKWFQQGTTPKMEDTVIIENWINGETAKTVGANNESELVASLRREITSHEREIATLEKHCGLIEKLYQEKILLFETNLNTALKNQARLVRQVSVALHLIAEHRAAGDREKLKAELDKIDMLNAEVLS